jgi:hypothetical protein
MDFKLSNSTNLQIIISSATRTLRNTTLLLLLMSFVIPFSYKIISTQAQSSNQFNSRVTVEKVKKDKTYETKEMSWHELKLDSDFVNLTAFNHSEQFKQAQLELTSEKVQHIESNKAVIYQNEVAIADQSVLTNLGYNSEQITLIQKMVDFYNSQTIKSINIKFETKHIVNKSNLFAIEAQAAPCQDEFRHDSKHWWGNRYFMNKCLVDHIEGAGDKGTIAQLIAAFFGVCTVVCSIMGLYFYLHRIDMTAKHKECGENGVFVDVIWSLDIEFKHIC